MKLVDLKPRWLMPYNWCGPDYYIGISFLCPHCPPSENEGRGPGKRMRLSVMFWPHIDPSKLREQYGPDWYPQVGPPVHQRLSGESFDTLTLSPSIGFESVGHWHGHITNGEVTPA